MTSPHGDDEENRIGDFVDRLGDNIGGDHGAVGGDAINNESKESPIPPTIRDDNGFPMEVAWAMPFNVKEWRDDFMRYNDAK
ncbi:hypothetical protein R1flu_011570 [Riccia fluitans]|uniref:Uncharacterized protein n=1 Tax=Riccia fluitans TaxID=41844 RepID=A0ABD1Z9A6_9MARC